MIMPINDMADIQLLLLDVDGVLTDGSVIYSDTGAEIKTFNVRDGLGLRLLMKAGCRGGHHHRQAVRCLAHAMPGSGH